MRDLLAEEEAIRQQIIRPDAERRLSANGGVRKLVKATKPFCGLAVI